MRIQIEVYDVDTDETLEVIGECLTDNPNRAIQMYDNDFEWCARGYNADMRWRDISSRAVLSAINKILNSLDVKHG